MESKPSASCPWGEGLAPLDWKDFEDLKTIGEGTYGRVYYAICKKLGIKVALKVFFPVPDGAEDGIPSAAIREMRTLEILNSQKATNVVKLIGACLNDDYHDYDLSGAMDEMRGREFPVPKIKCIMKQILSSLFQCYVAGLMHRDVKTSNVLMNREGLVVLADFGLSTKFTIRDHFSANVQTQWYRAPEVVLGYSEYNHKIDVWSTGCIFVELLMSKTPFPAEDDQQLVEYIVTKCGMPCSQNWPDVESLPRYAELVSSRIPHWQAVLPHVLNGQSVREHLKSYYGSVLDELALDLLSRMLDLNPRTRISAKDALNHDYFHRSPYPCDERELGFASSGHEMSARNRKIVQTKGSVPRSGLSASGSNSIGRPELSNSAPVLMSSMSNGKLTTQSRIASIISPPTAMGAASPSNSGVFPRAQLPLSVSSVFARSPPGASPPVGPSLSAPFPQVGYYAVGSSSGVTNIVESSGFGRPENLACNSSPSMDARTSSMSSVMVASDQTSSAFSSQRWSSSATIDSRVELKHSSSDNTFVGETSLSFAWNREPSSKRVRRGDKDNTDPRN